MIKLNRTPKPVELTDGLQTALILEFITTGNSVWNMEFLKEALLRFSYGKCCYCEVNITEESKYLEVEHFHPKKYYPNEVIEWENLLPSCKKCNGKKSSHNTVLEPIVNPTINNPKEHLKFWRYRIRGKDEVGKLTVSVLDLNNQDRLVLKRFEVGNAIEDQLEQFNEMTDEYISGHRTTRKKNRIVNGLKNLMEQGLPKSEYAATSSTVILNSSEFDQLKPKLETLNLWDDEFIELENSLSEIALEI